MRIKCLQNGKIPFHMFRQEDCWERGRQGGGKKNKRYKNSLGIGKLGEKVKKPKKGVNNT